MATYQYRGWTIRKEIVTQLGYLTEGRGSGVDKDNSKRLVGKGRKITQFEITYPEGGTKMVSSLKAAKEYINNYLGSGE